MARKRLARKARVSTDAIRRGLQREIDRGHKKLKAMHAKAAVQDRVHLKFKIVALRAAKMLANEFIN